MLITASSLHPRLSRVSDRMMTNSIPALDQRVAAQYYLHKSNNPEGYEENRIFQKGRGVALGGVILNGLKARSNPTTPKVLGQYKEVVVQPIPAGKSSDVLEAFLSEARSKRGAENIKTLRSIRLGQQIFHMEFRHQSCIGVKLSTTDAHPFPRNGLEGWSLTFS